MAQRHRIDEWVLEVWDGESYVAREVHNDETIDAAFAKQVAIMPNCPCRVIGLVYDKVHLGNLGKD